MPQYMLLLHDDQDAPGWKLSPEEMQRVFEKYLAWRKNPFVVDGRRLDGQTGRVIKKKSGQVTVTEGPFTEGRIVEGLMGVSGAGSAGWQADVYRIVRAAVQRRRPMSAVYNDRHRLFPPPLADPAMFGQLY